MLIVLDSGQHNGGDVVVRLMLGSSMPITQQLHLPLVVSRRRGGKFTAECNMLKAIFFLSALLGMARLASAVCPEKPVSLCQIVSQNSVVVRAKVKSTQLLVDDDDPEGVAGWIYHLDVVEDYRRGKSRYLAVISENTTSRISLETGKEYIVFASRNSEGQLETGNYCDPYSSRKFDRKTEQKIVTCLRNEKADLRK